MTDRDKITETFKEAKALNFLDDPYIVGFNDGIDRGKAIAMDLLKGQERLKAEWVYDRPHHWKCSECGTMYGESHIFFKYCPECGAKIRKE